MISECVLRTDAEETGESISRMRFVTMPELEIDDGVEAGGLEQGGRGPAPENPATGQQPGPKEDAEAEAREREPGVAELRQRAEAEERQRIEQERILRLSGCASTELRRGDWEAAMQTVREALQMAPDDPEVRAMRETVRELRERAEEERRRREEIEAILQKAILLMENWHYPHAEDVLKHALGRWPDEPALREARDRIALHRRVVIRQLCEEASRDLKYGNLDSAAAIVRKVSRIDPGNVEVQAEVRAMEKRIAEGRPQQARAGAERGVSKYIDFEMCYPVREHSDLEGYPRNLSRRGILLGALGGQVVVAGILTSGIIRLNWMKAPSIVITEVPAPGDAGPGPDAKVRGVVAGLSAKNYSEYRVVVYALTENKWRIESFSGEPNINSDGSWVSPTYPGSKYAALLVRKSYIPAEILPALPDAKGDGDVVAVTSINGPDRP